jgi:hypothetical protein
VVWTSTVCAKAAPWKIRRWRKEEEQEHGPSPADALGGYVLHCEMPVTNTKLTHDDVGMVREIEIKE